MLTDVIVFALSRVDKVTSGTYSFVSVNGNAGI